MFAIGCLGLVSIKLHITFALNYLYEVQKYCSSITPSLLLIESIVNSFSFFNYFIAHVKETEPRWTAQLVLCPGVGSVLDNVNVKEAQTDQQIVQDSCILADEIQATVRLLKHAFSKRLYVSGCSHLEFLRIPKSLNTVSFSLTM